jgi:hypothetical protein
MGFYKIGFQELFAWDWLWTVILLISSSWVTRITGVSHWLIDRFILCHICHSWASVQDTRNCVLGEGLHFFVCVEARQLKYNEVWETFSSVDMRIIGTKSAIRYTFCNWNRIFLSIFEFWTNLCVLSVGQKLSLANHLTNFQSRCFVYSLVFLDP